MSTVIDVYFLSVNMHKCQHEKRSQTTSARGVIEIRVAWCYLSYICLKLVFITKYAIKYPTHGCTNDDMRCTFSFMKLDYFSCYNDKGMIWVYHNAFNMEETIVPTWPFRTSFWNATNIILNQLFVILEKSNTSTLQHYNGSGPFWSWILYYWCSILIYFGKVNLTVN